LKKITFYFLLILPIASWSETIQPKDVVGAWVDSKPYSTTEIIIKWLADSDTYRLTISENFDVIFQRIFKSGKKHTIEVDRSQFTIHEDNYIINLPIKSGGKYKLVITGWKTKYSNKSLFGFLYLYNKEGLFNGWPIYLMPEG
jgi:hypothetical protein